MNYQQGGNRPQSPKIYHSALAQHGEASVQVLAPPKHGTTQQGKPYHKVRLNIFNPATGGYVEHSYFTTQQIADQLGQYVNQTITIVASGSDHPSQNTARIDVIPAHHGPAQAQGGYQQQAPAPQQSYQAPAPQPQMRNNSADQFAAAQTFIKQHANLARLCIVEAVAIAAQAPITKEQEQALASSFLIAAERAGHVASMPVQPINPFGGAPQPAPAQYQQPAPQGGYQGGDDDSEDIPF